MPNSHVMMNVVIVGCGILVILVSIALLVRPVKVLDWLRNEVQGYTWKTNLGEAVLRVVLGIIFVLAAEDSRFPLVLKTFGVILFTQGIVISVTPVHLHKRFALWALDLTSRYLRLATLVTIPFGALLIYAVM